MTDWIDQDVAPEWTKEVFECAEIRAGGRIVRPASGTITAAPVREEGGAVDKFDADLIEVLDGQVWKDIQSTMFRLTRSQAVRLRAALATREEAPADHVSDARQMVEAPAEAGALVGLVDYLENMRAETITDEGRKIMTEWIDALRAQPQAREEAQPVGCKQKRRPGGCQLPNIQCNYPECDK